MADLPSNIRDQYSRDNEFYLKLLTHQRRALIEHVSAYWPLAKKLSDSELVPNEKQENSAKDTKSE